MAILEILSAVAALFSVADSLIQRGNVKSAQTKLNAANKLIEENNIKIQQLQDYMDKRNMDYSQSMEFYQNSIRGSNMDKNRQAIKDKFKKDMDNAREARNDISRINATMSAAAQQLYNKDANTGIIGSLGKIFSGDAITKTY